MEFAICGREVFVGLKCVRVSKRLKPMKGPIKLPIP